MAEARVREAVGALRDPAVQRAAVKARKRGATTCTLQCPINVQALQELRSARGDTVVSSGEEGGWVRHGSRTYAQLITSLLDAAVQHESGEMRIQLVYQHSQLGRDLLDAGHVTASREYARGVDPFKMPKAIREAALDGLGWAMDDNEAYPRARIAMVPVGREGSQFLVDHREEIMKGFAELHLFPGLEWKEQRRRMKTIILGYDMDSGVDAWAK
eukprot:3692935-Prymnesium_polylepis.1